MTTGSGFSLSIFARSSASTTCRLRLRNSDTQRLEMCIRNGCLPKGQPHFAADLFDALLRIAQSFRLASPAWRS